MRNIVIHDYFGVDYKVIWDTAKDDLPKVKPHFKKLYEDLSAENKTKKP